MRSKVEPCKLDLTLIIPIYFLSIKCCLLIMPATYVPQKTLTMEENNMSPDQKRAV